MPRSRIQAIFRRRSYCCALIIYHKPSVPLTLWLVLTIKNISRLASAIVTKCILLWSAFHSRQYISAILVKKTDSSEVPNVDPATIEALLGVEDHCSSESPRCIFFQNVPYADPNDRNHCRLFQGTKPLYSNADSTLKTCCPSSILTDWIVSDYMTTMENQDGRLRPNERNGDWTVFTRDSPWQIGLNHKNGMVSQSTGGYTKYPFYLTIPSIPVQDFIRQPSPRMQDQNIPHSYIAENRNSNASVSDDDRQRLACGKQKDRELQVAWCDDTRWMHSSQGIQVENSAYKWPAIKIDCSQMHLGSSIFYSVLDTTK
ncbi:hypothetical protein CHS0354_013491 [Potamilus streckersoni]|uniref:Uncharacterized protein n=1 Tax=Potamilus streckersoni TaxID=2493646 RepID=A0AAE0T8F6_9BIVA|nr:hypothetical protein CHS0354_013491 [Potamilus streckersoni]